MATANKHAGSLAVSGQKEPVRFFRRHPFFPALTFFPGGFIHMRMDYPFGDGLMSNACPDLFTHEFLERAAQARRESHAETEIVVSEVEPSDEWKIRLRDAERALIACVGDLEAFSRAVGQIVRDSVDYVIDAPTMKRHSISKLQPDEKTTIGKRIENLIRMRFNLPQGDKLDIKLNGEDVDIKTSCTKQRSWMFAPSNRNHVNLLIAYDEDTAKFDLGVVFVTDELLGSENRDQKRGLGKDVNRRPSVKCDALEVKGHIRWIVQDQPYPPNFLAHLEPKLLADIVSAKTGMGRVRQLLSKVNGVPIPRHAICSVANQKDPMRRTRSNGGARDMWPKGVIVLSGAYDCDRLIASEALSIRLGDDETLTFQVADPKLTPELISAYAEAHGLAKR